MLNYFPKYFTNKAIALYIIALVAVSVVYLQFSMSWYIFLIGAVQVIGFFYTANYLTKKWSNLSSKTYTNKLFYNSLIIRIVWTVFSYFLYISLTGIPFEYSAGDSLYYHSTAVSISQEGFSSLHSIFVDIGISDTGYSTYLSAIYMIFGSDNIIIPRLLKAVWGAWTAVLVYKIATRNFGETTGKIAGILTMLMPNLIFYCGLHLKEVEMLFLATAFIERTDLQLRSKKNKHYQCCNIYFIGSNYVYF
ncbi:MAG: glycosyltransferase family 39 protein [Paludibacteraceae bacterium]